MPSSGCRTAQPSSHSGSPLAPNGPQQWCQAEHSQLHSAPSRRGTRGGTIQTGSNLNERATWRSSRLQMCVSQVSYSSTREYRAIQFSNPRNRRLSKGKMGPFPNRETCRTRSTPKTASSRAQPRCRGQELQHREAKISKLERRRGVKPETFEHLEKAPNALRGRGRKSCRSRRGRRGRIGPFRSTTGSEQRAESKSSTRKSWEKFAIAPGGSLRQVFQWRHAREGGLTSSP